MDSTPEQLTALFPHPGHVDLPNIHARRVPAPVRQAGWTEESTQAVLVLLKENHQRWHIFFNDMHFHNHVSHHLLAIYAMGASGELLKAAYETHTVYQKPAFPPPEQNTKSSVIIDDANWKEYLGDDRYYQAYAAYFTSKLVGKPDSMQTVLEDYVFSKDANVVPGKDGKAPMMLTRFLGGYLHPLIHCGYAIEFGLPGLIAEGVAQATSQATEAVPLFPPSLFETVSMSTLASRITSLGFIGKTSPPSESSVHALTVLARVAKDPAFSANAIGLPVPEGEHEFGIDRIARVAGDRLVELTQDWVAGLEKTENVSPEILSARFEEVVWMNTVIYAVGGWAGRSLSDVKDKIFNNDFFLMHLVTSALLTPALLNNLSPSSASLLLRTYFIFSLVLYIARGRPPLPVASFYAATTAQPEAPSPSPQPAKDTLPTHATPNPWLAIIQTTLVHPNEHLCKLQRALWHFADVYGGRPKGHFATPASDVEESPAGLEGFKELDGTLFVRAAGLTADRLGWMREGQEKGDWDNMGFFELKEGAKP